VAGNPVRDAMTEGIVIDMCRQLADAAIDGRDRVHQSFVADFLRTEQAHQPGRVQLRVL
jgi:hypothetical protein